MTESFEEKYDIVDIRTVPELKETAARWFCGKWGVSAEEYLNSMEESIAGSGPVPRWYVVVRADQSVENGSGQSSGTGAEQSAGTGAGQGAETKSGETVALKGKSAVCKIEGNDDAGDINSEAANIIAGAGIIENDFHERKDLAPNLCALYVEEEYRCQGIAGEILKTACDDMKIEGIDALYLVTDHTSFYERYGWEFIGMVRTEGAEEENEESCAVSCGEGAAAGTEADIRMYVHR